MYIARIHTYVYIYVDDRYMMLMTVAYTHATW